jgi:hypothetical protein
VSRVTAATAGANNMAGLVQQVPSDGSSETEGGSGAALGPYPHEQNGTPGGSWPGPVTQPPQNLGNV